MGEAQIWAMLGNINRKKNSRPFSPADLMPRDPRKPNTDWKHAQAAFWAMGKNKDADDSAGKPGSQSG